MKKHILTYNEFNRIVEELNSDVNSDLEVDKRAIQQQIKDFNSKKNNLTSIFAKDMKVWETEAAKLIQDNKYLAIWWKIKKIEHQLEVAKKTPQPDNKEDAKSNANKLAELQRDLNDAKKEMITKQNNDLKLLRL